MIQADKFSAIAELKTDSEVAEAIWDTLPFKGRISRLRDRVFFSIPLSALKLKEDSSAGEGDLGYWPVGNAFCIFLGESEEESSAINVIGRLNGDLESFRELRHGETIRVRKKGLDEDVS